jgi:type I restriction-modification system DNA methylase subunit
MSQVLAKNFPESLFVKVLRVEGVQRPQDLIRYGVLAHNLYWDCKALTPADLKQLEANLWQSADTLRANSDLKSSEYATPVLGLIFLKFADNKYRQYETEIQEEYEKLKGGRREKPIVEIALEKCGFYLPEHARYDYLLTLPEEKNIAQALKAAMVAIEEYKPELKGVLPQDEYFRLVRGNDKGIPKRLLKNFSDIPADATGDMFGQIYQYFLGNFALAEGQGGGEFFTPDSVVRLMVDIIEPQRGKLLDPACGSGGMFVQSGQFIQEHAEELKTDPNDFFVYGQEKTLETVTLPATLWFFDKGKTDDKILFIDARNVFTQVDRAHREFSAEHVSNLAVISHLRRGKQHRFIRLIDHYFQQGWAKLVENQAQVKPVSEQLIAVLEDGKGDLIGKQAAIDFLQLWDGLEALEKQYKDPTLALPLLRGGNQAIEAQNQAQQQLSRAFEPFFADLHKGLKRLDKTVRAHEMALAEKAKQEKNGKRTQIDRQVKALKTTLEELHTEVKSAESFFAHIRWLQERFPEAKYEDVTGLCKLANPEEVKEQDFSLNPGRYVGVVIEEDGKTEEEFIAEILDLDRELARLNQEAHLLEGIIAHNVKQLAGEL